MTAQDFSSRNGLGFYQDSNSRTEHSMDWILKFERGLIDGTGFDDVDQFVIQGSYELETGRSKYRDRWVHIGLENEQGKTREKAGNITRDRDF